MSKRKIRPYFANLALSRGTWIILAVMSAAALLICLPVMILLTL
jgi:hypothetical protein